VRVVEALAGPQVEAVPVHRRGHERHVTVAADDPLGEHRVAVERVVVGQRVHGGLVDPEDRHRLAVHQSGRTTGDLELREPADRLPLDRVATGRHAVRT
jgi:hypothetical protein